MDKQLFGSAKRRAPKATTRNAAGGLAYELDAREALAQVAATGTFGNTYYVGAKEQLDEILELAKKCEPDYVAKVAVYARQAGYMKDTPALLTAYLSTVDPDLMRRAFVHTIDNGRMVRNFVQAIRSGRLGRKSLGSAPKKCVQKWLQGRSEFQLFRDSIGNDPSLLDVIKMTHPKLTPRQSNMVAYLMGKPYDINALPESVREYERFKTGEAKRAPRVPSRFLQGLELNDEAWKSIARHARWMETRMNLNTYARHNVFKDKRMVELVADRIRDPEHIHGARAFPYQLVTAWQNTPDIPVEIQLALQDAVDVAVDNVPTLTGNVVVCPDVSASMCAPVTGYRGKQSNTTCVDVAGLVTAAIVRKNPGARVIPFNTRALDVGRINPRDSVMTITKKIASMLGGGTACSAPLHLLNREKAKVDSVLFISDNQSWYDTRRTSGFWGEEPTSMMDEWVKLKGRNRHAKMVCLDVTPNTRVQATNITGTNILNVGGFSDVVFRLMSTFFEAELDWPTEIESIEL